MMTPELSSPNDKWRAGRALRDLHQERRGWRHQLAYISGLLQRDRSGILGLALFLLLVFSALFAPWISQHDPLAQDLSLSRKPPAWYEAGRWDYPLGTDNLGRDVFSRVIYGSRVSLTIGLFGVLMAGSIGLVLGLISGYMGGWVDSVIVGAVNLVLGLPTLLFVVVIASIVGQSITNVILIFGVVGAPIFVRLTRGEVLRIRESGYVESAVCIGARTPRILFNHILPNLIGPLITLATLQMSGVIFFEAGLGFLGLSVPPSIPSWGNMLATGRKFLIPAPWIATFPGLAIMLAALGMNLLGDWLRDVLDPRLRRSGK
jgi:peptide/nickel transport system permease protein